MANPIVGHGVSECFGTRDVGLVTRTRTLFDLVYRSMTREGSGADILVMDHGVATFCCTKLATGSDQRFRSGPNAPAYQPASFYSVSCSLE